MKNFMVLAAAVSVASAFAQDNSSVTPYQAAIRAGVAIPLNSTVSGTHFGVGLDYTLERSLLKGGQTYIALDFITKSSRGDRSNMFSGLLSQRFMFSEGTGMSGSTRTYGFLGIGAAMLDFGSSSTVLAARGGFGAEFSPNVFGELSLTFTSKGKSTDAQGNFVGFYIGYRF